MITSGPGGVFGTTADDATPIQSAIYNPSNLTVTVTPAGVLPMTRLNRIVIYGRANQLLTTGVVDTNGDLLAGSNGIPGAPFVTIFGVGTRLTYPDGTGNIVTLRLTRGGLMELFQAPSGQIQQLVLIGIVPNQSTLTGTVRRGPHGSGRTAMPPITGGAGVRIRLKPPAFGSPSSARPATAKNAKHVIRVVHPAPETPRPFSRLTMESVKYSPKGYEEPRERTVHDGRIRPKHRRRVGESASFKSARNQDNNRKNRS